MSKILATPGPCPVPPEALAVLSLPVEHHRTDEFKKMFARVASQLKLIFQTQNEVLLHCSSGTGAMESLVVNLHSPGDKVVCLTAGKFGSRWVGLAKAYGLQPIELKAEWGLSPSPHELENLLNTHPEIKSVFVQACETSTGQKHPIQEYADVMRGRNSLLLVDAITAIGAYDLPMDKWGLDGLVGGAQKAFASLTGLSFVSLSSRAWKAYENATLPRYYFDLGPEREAQLSFQTRFSSAVSLMKSLSISLDFLIEGGLQKHFDLVERRARFCRDFALSLGLSLFPTNPSPSLSVLNIPKGVNGEELQKHIQAKYDVVFMGGQDDLKGKVIRWGHMGYQTPTDEIRIAEALGKGLEDFGFLKSSDWKVTLQRQAEAYRLV